MTDFEIAAKIRCNQDLCESLVRFLRELASQKLKVKRSMTTEERAIRGSRNIFYNLGDTEYVRTLDDQNTLPKKIDISKKRKGGRKAP